MSNEKYDFEPFAETEEYKEINNKMIKRWIDLIIEKGSENIENMLDIATGAGTMVQLFFSNLPDKWKEIAVLCVDQSAEALKLAKKRLEKDIKKLVLINSKIEDLDLPENSVDIAVWGNGIHYLSESAQLECLKKIKQILKPGGWFFFNTAFYEEARPPETLSFYRSQVKKAVEFLRKKGITREKTQNRVEASRFHPKSHYEQLVELAGFKLEEASELAARLKKEAWEHISSFQQYATGALRGYPAEEAAEAMKHAVEPALIEHGEKDEDGNLYVVRNWLAVSARA